MAVVFISPKKRQRTFFLSLAGVGLAVVVLMSFGISFFSAPSQDQVAVSFNKPKVTVNLKVLDSERFKALENFETIPPQFEYSATTTTRQTVTGVLSSPTREAALAVLEAAGLTVTNLEEITPGRDNPFVPY